MNKSDFFTADAVKPHFTYDDYCESADMIASHLGDFRPEVLLVLGSGLGFLGDRVEARTCVSYADIPHFRASTAPGHEGRFVFGELRGKRVAVMQGRMHCYEGYTMEDAAYACRVIRLLGAKTMIVTNAAGAVNTEYSAGDLMLISDHIKLFDFGPLWGPNIDEFGTRFPDMSNVYSPACASLPRKSPGSRTSRCARASTCTSPARSLKPPLRCAPRACSARTPWACPPCRRPSPPRTAGMKFSA